MDRNEGPWIIHFFDGSADDREPMRSRMNRLLKYAGRRLGLTWRNPFSFRDAVIEWCCRRMCPQCAAGLPVARGPAGIWLHVKGTKGCRAAPIREARREEDSRRWEKAKDAAGHGRSEQMHDVRKDTG